MKLPSAAPHSLVILMLVAAWVCPASARADSGPSELSEVSTLPVAVSVALPVLLVGGAGSLVVQGVENSADGVVWFVENTVDGATASVRVVGRAAGASAVAVGTVITVTTTSAGLLLSATGQAIAFIPNEIGRAMFYDQKVSR